MTEEGSSPPHSHHKSQSKNTDPFAHSIPTRRELVKNAARHKTHAEVRETQAQTSQYRWTTCPLSKKPLTTPVVSDSLGILYNKESIIEWILRGTEAFGDGEEVLDGRVKSLRDVVEVVFESLQEDSKADAENARAEKWVCSVSRKELGPGAKAVYLVPCGHAFAESAVKELGGAQCLVVSSLQLCVGGWLLTGRQCNAPYESSNIIPINPTDPAETERLQERIKVLAENGLTHALKKLPSDKKSKKRRIGADSEAPRSKKSKEAGIRNPTAAALTSRVLKDERLKQQQRKLQMSDSVKTLFTSKQDGHKPGKNKDFMSRGYSIPSHMK